MQGIDAQQFTGRAHLGSHRQARLVEHDADLSFARHLVQSARQTTAGWIFHGANAIAACGQCRPHQAVEWRHVGYQRAFQLQLVPRRHDCEAVIAQTSSDDDAISASQARIGHHPAGEGHARRVDDQAVELALAHDLGVAGHDAGARFGASRAHRIANAFQIRNGKASFNDDRASEPHRFRGTHHCQVIDGAANGQPADIATGKEERFDDIGVSSQHQEAIAHRNRRAVVHSGEARAGWAQPCDKHAFDERAHGRAARAVFLRNCVAELAHVVPPRSGRPPY